MIHMSQEAFDNIGSSRMVYDMKVGDFPFALSEADSDDVCTTLHRVCIATLFLAILLHGYHS